MPHLRTAPTARPAPRPSAPAPSSPVLPLSALLLRVLPLAVLLGGCTLIDQRTFNPDAGTPPVVAAAPAAPAAAPAGPPALLTVRFDRPVAIEGPVRQAVALARARKPDAAFDVVSVVPDAGAVEAGGAEAARVARLITAQGVPAARVTLQVRLDPAAVARDVRVFVR